MMRKFRYIAGGCLLIALTAAFCSCKKQGGSPERSDYIRVYASTADDTPLDQTWVSVKGGTFTYYIRSNADFSVQWQSEDMSWASISEPKNLGSGLWSIDISARPVSERVYTTVDGIPTGLYSYRYGVLMLTSKDVHLGKYFAVHQGFEGRINCDFSWLYGSRDPNDTYNDVLMSRWTAAQLNQGFTSTVIDGEEQAWVYGKEGYLRLGNGEGAGADLITPHTADFQYDTLMVVSFRAVAQSGDNLPDFSGGTEPIVPMNLASARAPMAAGTGTLRVEVSGGGYIRDLVETGGTSISLDLPTYDRNSPDFPDDMFDQGRFLVFIEGTDNNPITVNTKIRFIAGDMQNTEEGSASPVFLDDIFVYRIDQWLDEDIFSLNGGKSGKDNIAGGKAE